LFDAHVPLKVEPHFDESGHGYCLRAGTVNGVNLQGLKRLLKLGAGVTLRSEHAEILGALLQVDTHRLAHTLPTPFRGSKGLGAQYFGHRFLTKNHLRTRNPQVCPECLRSGGYCRAVWDLSISTICERHDRYLLDHCLDCGQQIRWHRPSVDVGHCGHYLSKKSTAEKSASELHEIQSLIDSIFARGLIDAPAHHQGIPHDLVGMSIDGLTTLTFAFGVLPEPYAVVPYAVHQRSLTSAYVQEVATRGLIRLKGMYGEDSAPAQNRELVAEALLLRLVLLPANDGDRAVGLQMATALYGESVVEGWAKRYPELSQLRLF
jgi:TniQ